jgi:hypothetical protein
MNAKLSESLRWFLLAVLLLVAGVPAAAAAGEDDEDEAEFVPRTGAPPARRTGGASRHDGDAGPRVSVLAPANAVGLTGRERPVIYWYLSEPTDAPVEIGINRKDKSAVLELTLEGKREAGFHALDLGKLESDGKPVALEPGVVYDVAIVVAADADNPSKNPSATARVMRVDPAELSEAARKPATAGDPAELASAYAKEGLWLDYVDALNRAVKAKPRDRALLDRRAKALAKEGLVLKPDGALTEAPDRGGNGGAAE